jgi:serine/threonine protein kinase
MLTPPVRALQAGDRLLDRYTILSELTPGGMATIYRAQDERLDRVVCAKVLKHGRAAEPTKLAHATYKHFQKEALALSKLQHPNTLRIYDYGVFPEDGRPIQISEFMDGGTLEEKVRADFASARYEKGSADVLAETRTVLEPMAGALEEAHAHRIIHRDIKPSNILFGSVGSGSIVKLADFGIALSELESKRPPSLIIDEPSISSVALFSPRWAAPEQLCGLPAQPATDVYSLALVTVFMLTGEVLFSHKVVNATYNDRVHDDALVLGRLAELGLGTNTALVSALRADLRARTKTAREFLSAMQREQQPQVVRLNVPELPAKNGAPLQVDHPPGNHEPARSKRGQNLQVIPVPEHADLSFDGKGSRVRFRVSFLPTASTLQVKGLSSFVRLPGRTATTAVNVEHDSVISFASATGALLGSVEFYGFNPSSTPGMCVFVVDGVEMMIPSDRGFGARVSGSTEVLAVIRSR